MVPVYSLNGIKMVQLSTVNWNCFCQCNPLKKTRGRFKEFIVKGEWVECVENTFLGSPHLTLHGRAATQPPSGK